MPMHNLIKYSSSFSETTGSLWFYSKDEATNFNADIANNDSFKSFRYKAKLLGNTAAQPAPNAANDSKYVKYKAKLLENTVAYPAPNQAHGILKKAKISVPFKYFSNFWRSLEMPLINCKIELKLKWKKYCFLCAKDNDIS